MKNEVLVFKERAGKPGGGKGILITKDKAFTLATTPIDAVCYDARGNGEGGCLQRSQEIMRTEWPIIQRLCATPKPVSLSTPNRNRCSEQAAVT